MGKAKLNIPMCAALVLLFLTMLSIHLTSGLYARYTATSTASDSARVAKFDVTAAVQPVDGKEGEFTLTVTNNSEVAVEYQVVVTLSDRLDAEIRNPADITEANGKSVSGDEQTITFTNSQWELAPNTGVRTHTLQFEIQNWVGMTKTGVDFGETESVAFDFKVEVTAQQID